MAEGKESFLLHKKHRAVFEKLSNEDAGKLIKLIFAYISDENPTPENFILDLAFEPIKQDLKIDLKKWESICERNRYNGRKGGRPTNNPENPVGYLVTQKTQTNPDEPKKPDNEYDNEYEYEEINKEKFNFKKSLLSLGVTEKVVTSWLKVRKEKKAVNTEIAFEAIRKQIEQTTGVTPNDCINLAVIKSWSGYKAEWYFNEMQKSSQTATTKSNAKSELERFYGKPINK